MSLALYRTYRPGRLSEVVGQEHVTEPLGRALSNDRVHHAYLFSGPRGCGKTSTARILARSLNCERGPTPDPCGECESCIGLAPNGPGTIDVIELDAASHGGVDDTRDLRERAMFAPAVSRYKIYIIDEAHMVSTQGFNALLKLVEEPPPHVRFIFATTEADKVLATIRSRTHNYSFRLVSARVLQQHLAGVCEAEGYAAEPAALALVARAGAGSVRDSLSILGQLIAGSGPEGLTYADAVEQLGVTDTALIDQAVDALAAADGAALFGVVDRVVDAGHDPRRFVTDLLERLRDLIVLASVPGAAESGLVSAPDAQLEAMVAQSGRLGLTELSRAADLVSAGLSELKGATAPRLQLELLAARLLIPAADDGSRGLGARLDRVERWLGSLAAGQSAAAPAAATAPAAAPAAVAGPSPVSPSTTGAVGTGVPARESAPPAPAAPESSPTSGPAAAPVAPAAPTTPSGGVDQAQIRSMWPAVLEAMKAPSRVAWMIFAESIPMSYDGELLVVGLSNPGAVANVQKSGHDERLRQAVIDVLRIDPRIDVILDPAATSAAPKPAARAAEPSPRDAAESAEPTRPARATTSRRVAATTKAAGPAATADAAAVPAPVEPDVPRPDDPDLETDGRSGIDLAISELGATHIGDIENA